MVLFAGVTCCSDALRQCLQFMLGFLLWCVQVELGMKQEVVVYDQSSKEAGHLSKDGFVQILLGKLEGTFHRVSLLTGRSSSLCVCVCACVRAQVLLS